ncbi:MAG TPA: PLP-dependent aminotransferase family protein [Bryobacteraceae bacterium]|jgi:DNA-binding transcriptional MocR family regulator|nr:PLP-dependent aminotransferase family protein [Bryobacteraceae bacterium]
MDIRPHLNPDSEVSLYRQLGEYLQALIESGELRTGDRLPPTRELAGQLGLNRTTVSAAYDLLEHEGLIKGEVGRGSYVCGQPKQTLDWSRTLTASLSTTAGSPANGVINFTSSSPSDKLFPLEEFRKSCREVLESRDLKTLMRLGSPGGYEPLRRYLRERAVQNGIARDTDDVLITNGCQQALDLLRRALVKSGAKVAIEEPVYPGLKNLFLEAGADLIGVSVGAEGVELPSLQEALDAGAKVVVLTPSFQNPTGTTIPASNRNAICSMARAAGAVVIENDIYSELSYTGAALPKLKQLDPNVILLGSFSKVAFPGIRVGWIIAPRPVIKRVTELKQLADLHTDHLSQAFLLHFAETGKLAQHRENVIAAAKEKLRALEQSCRRYLDGCVWNMPAGGMNIWIQLPAGVDAVALRGLAQQAGIDYLPGRYFSIARPLDSGLRLSFAGLEANEIRKGIEILGGLIHNAIASRDETASQPALALV